MKTLLVTLSAALLLILPGPGCNSTVAPRPLTSTTASFDGTNHTSGLIAFDPATGHALITPHARDRYNGLIQKYGAFFIPPLQPDAGISPTNGLYRIDPEHLSRFIRMNRWHKEGRNPLKP